MGAPSFSSLRVKIRATWNNARISSAQAAAIDKKAREILANKDKYEDIQRATGVPWFLVGTLHYRESDNSFNRHLHEGSPLSGRTRFVPKGYPKTGSPPFTWRESAIDALKLKKLHQITDWSIERILYEAERFNGFGYHFRNRPSPYVWSGTDQYRGGKFVADHVYDPEHWDKQLGVASIIKRIDQLDQTFNLDFAAPSVPEVVQSSKSLPALIVSGLLYVGTQLTNAIQSSWDALGSGFDMLPALVSGTSDHVRSSEQVANWLGMDWATFGKYAVLGTMAFVFIRLVKNKQDLEKAQAKAEASAPVEVPKEEAA